MAIYLTDHRRHHALTREQVVNLLNWMKVCKKIMDGGKDDFVTLTITEAEEASRATRKALEADGCHINYEGNEFVAYRGIVRYS